MQHLLSIDEAARALRVSIFTLRRWTAEARIPHVRLGRRVLFNPSELERWIVESSVRLGATVPDGDLSLRAQVSADIVEKTRGLK